MTAANLDELERSIARLSVDAAVEHLRAAPDFDQRNVQDLLDIAARRAQSDASAAAHALDIGDRLAPELACAEAIPASRYLRARIVLNSGRPDRALELIGEARSRWLELGRAVDAFRTDLGRMHVLDDLGRHGDAVTVAEALLGDLDTHVAANPEAEGAEQLEWIKAAATENLGVAYGFTGRHQQALDAYRTAEERYRTVGDADDMARCRANRGVELVAIGRAVEGLEVLQSAAEMFEDLDDRLSYAQCLGHVADAELLLGLYAAALTRYEQARGLLDELEARSEGCRVRLRTVRAYLALNLIDEAEVLARQTEEDLVELALRHDVAEARWLCAVAQFRAGRAADALERLDRALVDASDSDDPPLMVKILLARSDVLADLGDETGARDASRQALEVVAEGDWPTEELHVQLRVAQLAEDPSIVDRHLARAERLADELGLPHLRYPVLLELGRHRRRQGGDEDARRWLRAAVDVVEGLRGLIPDEALRTSYLEGRTAAHVDLMSMLIESELPGDQLAAFDLAEASKARTLADILAGVVQPGAAAQTTADRSTAEADSGLDRYEADLHAAYSALSAGEISMTRERRRAVQDRAVELEQAIRLAHLQVETKRDHPGERSGAEAPLIRPSASEQVIEYHIVGDEVVVFVWSGGRLSVAVADAPVDRIFELIAHWNRRRQRFDVATQVDAAGAEALVAGAEEALRGLWQELLAPVMPHLDPANENLIVVPHGPLHAVPFHALMGPDGPVGRDRTVTTALSYAVAGRLGAASPVTGGRSSLVLGVPDELAPAVATEARAVADMLPEAELLLGSLATTEALVERLSEPRDVVHLACHGLHRSRNPMFSALKLADGWLTAKDVLGLRLHGALVVLSACETGRQGGPATQGEAAGLARSFLAAGASAVIVSLWPTDDAVTAELMTHFYRSLRAGLLPAAALRSAQAAAAEIHPHPAAWAPFVIHGGGKGES